MTIQELLSEYEELVDWEEQCDYLIDIGRELPVFPEEFKTDSNIVHGCQSRVWLVAGLDQSHDHEFVRLQADSDAMIVRGLIAVLLAAYQNKTPQQVLDTDIEGLFERMGLNRHLSSSRRNGLHGMVERIRRYASEIVGAEGSQ
ncbi:MAG: SufE family protein [Planctomyces sp.]|nr:SufE family protein [Planctomyces sp.]